LRQAVKARDAYDVQLLQKIGSALSANLRAHLQDTILANEIDSDTISNRIGRVDEKPLSGGVEAHTAAGDVRGARSGRVRTS